MRRPLLGTSWPKLQTKLGYSRSSPSPLKGTTVILLGCPDGVPPKPTQMRGFEMALPEQPQEGRGSEGKEGTESCLALAAGGREGDCNFLPTPFTTLAARRWGELPLQAWVFRASSRR